MTNIDLTDEPPIPEEEENVENGDDEGEPDVAEATSIGDDEEEANEGLVKGKKVRLNIFWLLGKTSKTAGQYTFYILTFWQCQPNENT